MRLARPASHSWPCRPLPQRYASHLPPSCQSSGLPIAHAMICSSCFSVHATLSCNIAAHFKSHLTSCGFSVQNSFGTHDTNTRALEDKPSHQSQTLAIPSTLILHTSTEQACSLQEGIASLNLKLRDEVLNVLDVAQV